MPAHPLSQTRLLSLSLSPFPSPHFEITRIIKLRIATSAATRYKLARLETIVRSRIIGSSFDAR